MYNTTEETIAELRAKINELEASLKVDKFDYPICKKSKISETIVLFDGLKKGKVLFQGDSMTEKGYYGLIWTPHTDTKIWEDYPYDKERNLYHKQMVYCFNNNYTHSVNIRFYNAINKCAYNTNGTNYNATYHNYSAEIPEFLKEAYKTLKD